MKELKEEKVKDIIKEIETTKDDNQMLKTVKSLYMKRKKMTKEKIDRNHKKCII